MSTLSEDTSSKFVFILGRIKLNKITTPKIDNKIIKTVAITEETPSLFLNISF